MWKRTKQSLPTETKIENLAKAMGMAIAAYDSGRHETAVKLMHLIVSQLETSEEQRALHRLVVTPVRRSGMWPHYQEIVLGAALTAAPAVEPTAAGVPQRRRPWFFPAIAVAVPGEKRTPVFKRAGFFSR